MSTDLVARPPTPLGRSALWNVTGGIATGVTGVVVVGASFRSIDHAVLGTFLTLLAAQTMLGLLEPVMATVVSRIVAQQDAVARAERNAPSLRSVINALGAIGASITLLGGLSCLVWISLERPPAGLVVSSLILLATTAMQLVSAHLPGAALGDGRFSVVAIGTTLGGVTNVIVVFALVGALGTVGVALGQLCNVMTSRLILLWWRRRGAPWLSVRLSLPQYRSIVNVWSDVSSLVLLSVAAQIITWSDLLIIGAFRGSASAADYRLGIMIPTTVAGLLFRAYDVAFPRLARGSALQGGRNTEVMTKVFAAASGAVFAGILMERVDLLRLLAGHWPSMAVSSVTLLTCFVWAANVPVHGLALQRVAEGTQGPLVPLVLTEALLNMVMTVLLTWRFGIVGAATATLVAIGVSNLLALPMILKRRHPGCVRLVFGKGVLPLLCSMAAAAAALVATLSSVSGPWWRLATGGIVATAVASAATLLAAGSTGRAAIRGGLFAP